jgi:hypothetical protein
MDFNITEILDFTRSHLANYLAVFGETVTKPLQTYQIQQKYFKPTGTHASPALWVYVVISIFLGVTLASLVPKRLEEGDFLKVAVACILVWYLFGFMAFFIYRLFAKPDRSRSITVSICLHISATVYVLSNFLALLYSGVSHLYPSIEIKVWYVDLTPMNAYYFLQVILFTLYFFMAMYGLRGMRIIKLLLYGLSTSLIYLVLGLPIFLVKGC